MTDKIQVRAVKDEHMKVLSHAGGPPLTKDGVLWPYDGFTCQLLVEGAIERVPEDEAIPKPAAEESAPAPTAKPDPLKLPPVPDPTQPTR